MPFINFEVTLTVAVSADALTVALAAVLASFTAKRRTRKLVKKQHKR